MTGIFRGVTIHYPIQYSISLDRSPDLKTCIYLYTNPGYKKFPATGKFPGYRRPDIKYVEVQVEIHDMGIILDMKIMLDMEIILVMEDKHHTLHRIIIHRRKQLYH